MEQNHAAMATWQPVAHGGADPAGQQGLATAGEEASVPASDPRAGGFSTASLGRMIMGEALEDVLKLSREARNFCVDVLGTVGQLVVGRAVNELFFVPVIILSRMLRQHDAIEVLLPQGFVPEAAILVLTQFELCLDVLYLDNNVHRATEWMDHESMRHAPWKVKDKIEEVYSSDPPIRDAKQKYFEVLSAIKHGNPLAGGFGFGIRRDGNQFSVTDGEIDDHFSQTHAVVIAGADAYQLIEGLRGACRAFSRFVTLDTALSPRIEELLKRCRQEIGRAVHKIERSARASSLH